MNGMMIILIVAVAVLAAAVVYLTISLNFSRKALADAKAEHERSLKDQKASSDELMAHLKSSYERTLAETKAAHQNALEQQLKAIRAEMTAESERVLKAREEELEKRAKATFESLACGLDKNIKDMREAFDLNRKTQAETSQSLKDNLENAVKNLREQTASIGDKADSLADALRGRNKTQGNWGEVILDNLFTNEGLREGRDYDREETLRDEQGVVILNEDTSKRMRPDYILHYPDGNDVIVD